MNTLHDEAGKNLVDDLCDRYEPLMGALDEAAIEELLDELDSGTDNNDFLLLRAQLHRPENQTRSSARGKAQLYPFNTTPFGEGDGEFTEAVIEMEGLSWFSEFAIEGRARWIVREAENHNGEVTAWLRRKKLDERTFLLRHATILNELLSAETQHDPAEEHTET